MSYPSDGSVYNQAPVVNQQFSGQASPIQSTNSLAPVGEIQGEVVGEAINSAAAAVSVEGG